MEKLYNMELNDFYSSPNIVWAIKWRRMRWVEHMEVYGGEDYTYFRWGNQRERDHSGDADVDGRTILTWIFRK